MKKFWKLFKKSGAKGKLFNPTPPPPLDFNFIFLLNHKFMGFFFTLGR